jgi:hypothetical protein
VSGEGCEGFWWGGVGGVDVGVGLWVLGVDYDYLL